MVLYLSEQKNRVSGALMGHRVQPKEEFLLMAVITTSQEGKP